MFALIRAKYCV